MLGLGMLLLSDFHYVQFYHDSSHCSNLTFQKLVNVLAVVAFSADNADNVVVADVVVACFVVVELVVVLSEIFDVIVGYNFLHGQIFYGFELLLLQLLLLPLLLLLLTHLRMLLLTCHLLMLILSLLMSISM